MGKILSTQATCT